ncbi:hypothetical protein ANN_04553 [Periplaneta americana]|uniref:Uncharacterized protein n=1 Tax=Periplaneta americana TaxID=6978 RepID=A0ABQ8TAT8_PERAM|nr:hypothetical protein ANN_04553 [Periplaneta americana]
MEVTRIKKVFMFLSYVKTFAMFYYLSYLVIDFREVVAELDSVIPAAQFLAIDGEFTGLHTGQDVNAFDTPAQYYSKLRSGGMDFLLVQFGLCAFSYDEENDK